MADTLTTLQQLHLLAAGKAANTAVLGRLEASVATNGYTQVDNEINSNLNDIETNIGTAATLQMIARRGLGLELTLDQATRASADLKANGLNTWAKILHWAADNQTALTTTLDNRTEAAQHFRTEVHQKGTAGFYSGHSADAAVTNILLSVGDSALSLAQAKAALTALAGKFGPNGISGTLYGSYGGIEVRADTNNNWWWSGDEWGVVTQDDGRYTIPANADAGRLIVHGGVDMMTRTAFTGVMSAPSGSTVINPFTSMVQSLLESGQNMQQALASVKTAFGLGSDINLFTYDSRRVLIDPNASAATKATALAHEKTQLQIANVTTQIGAAIDAAGTNGASADRSYDVTKALAAVVQASANAGTKVDLTDSTLIARVIANADTSGMVTGSAARLTTLVDASNTAIVNASNGISLAKAATVTQGKLVGDLILAMDNNTLDAALSAYTGANLDAKIAAAQPLQFLPGMEISLVGTTTVGVG